MAAVVVKINFYSDLNQVYLSLKGSSTKSTG